MLAQLIHYLKALQHDYWTRLRKHIAEGTRFWARSQKLCPPRKPTLNWTILGHQSLNFKKGKTLIMRFIWNEYKCYHATLLICKISNIWKRRSQKRSPKKFFLLLRYRLWDHWSQHWTTGPTMGPWFYWWDLSGPAGPIWDLAFFPWDHDFRLGTSVSTMGPAICPLDH